ncbi:MAG TPA: hypothetical protein VFX70_08255 [Mycobacteriales bacterium]|nr:hypothetical protein [Mycobacteriales bacterium]
MRVRCRAVGFDLDKATVRSRLIVLRALVGDAEADTAEAAEAAWAGLSRACHQHAYELAPTTGEVSHLVGLVTILSTLIFTVVRTGRLMPVMRPGDR